jgi:nitrate reductase NapE component
MNEQRKSNAVLSKVDWRRRLLIATCIFSLIAVGFVTANLLITYHFTGTNVEPQIKLYNDTGCTQEIPLSFQIPGLIGNGSQYTVYAKNIGNVAENFTFNIQTPIGANILISPSKLELNPGSIGSLTLSFFNVAAPISFDLAISD